MKKLIIKSIDGTIFEIFTNLKSIHRDFADDKVLIKYDYKKINEKTNNYVYVYPGNNILTLQIDKIVYEDYFNVKNIDEV